MKRHYLLLSVLFLVACADAGPSETTGVVNGAPGGATSAGGGGTAENGGGNGGTAGGSGGHATAGEANHGGSSTGGGGAATAGVGGAVTAGTGGTSVAGAGGSGPESISPPAEWARSWVGFQPRALARDGNGRVAVAGTTQPGADLGQGPVGEGIGLVVLGADGAPQWAHHFAVPAGSVEDFAQGGDKSTPLGVAFTADSVVVVGRAAGIEAGGVTLAATGGFDAFVLRVTTDGATAAARLYGNATPSEFSAVVAGSPGEIVVGGSFAGSLSLGSTKLVAADRGAFVAVLDSTGIPTWSRHFVATAGLRVDVGGLAISTDGAVLAVGAVGPIQGQFPGDSSLDLGGGPIPVGGTPVTQPFVVSLDAAGARWGSVSFENGRPLGVDIDPSGRAWIAGTFLGVIPDPMTPEAAALGRVVDAKGALVGEVPSGPDALWGQTPHRTVGAATVLGDGRARLAGFRGGAMTLAGAALSTLPDGPLGLFLADVALDAGPTPFSASALRDYPGFSHLAGIAVASDGGTIVAGWAEAPVDFGGVAANGGFVVALPP